MSQNAAAPSAPVPIPQPSRPELDAVERAASNSQGVAWCVTLGLPLLGLLAALVAQLPFFAALMSGCFLLATALVARKAVTTFASGALRLLVTARLVVVLVLGAVLFCVTGSAWAGVVSAVLLWLVADRVLGRKALRALGKAGREVRARAGRHVHRSAPSPEGGRRDPREA